MSFLVERILELASHRSEEPNHEEDFIDLGLESFDQDPNKSGSTDSSKHRLSGASYSTASQSKRLIGLTPNNSDDRSPNSCSC